MSNALKNGHILFGLVTIFFLRGFVMFGAVETQTQVNSYKEDGLPSSYYTALLGQSSRITTEEHPSSRVAALPDEVPRGSTDLSSPLVLKPHLEVEASPRRNCVFIVNGREDKPHWSFSFLSMLRHHTSPVCNYQVEFVRFQNRPDRLEKQSKIHQRSGATCIVVSTKQKIAPDTRENYAPNCHLMITNDEFCAKDTDLRLYYNEKKRDQLYLPLGPRGDFREAYQERKERIRKEGATLIPPMKERPYLFNAIFSRSTSKSRTPLQQLLNTSATIRENPQDYFIHIVDKWSRKSQEHINSTHYTEILSQSKFTVAPSGHNPECYRLYEAMLMGSIPIVVLDDEYQQHHCPNALRHLLVQDSEAPPPLVVLEHWKDLEKTLTSLQEEGPEALEERQVRMRKWVKTFFANRFQALDEYLSKSPYPSTWKKQ